MVLNFIVDFELAKTELDGSEFGILPNGANVGILKYICSSDMVAGDYHTGTLLQILIMKLYTRVKNM